MVVVAIIGILAAVAIPSFLKNARKAKTAEATMNVKKMQTGAMAYYLGESNKAGSATPIAKQFPDTAAADTEPTQTCCIVGAATGQKCAPDPANWVDPTWQALAFSMDDPHYYQYRYVHNAPGTSGAVAPQITPTFASGEWFYSDALGDLNCDGVLSTFEMLGAINADGSVTTGGGLYKNNEIE